MEAISKYPWGKGTPTWTNDATTNDSDKTVLTVPTGKLALILGIYISFAATATVGNRVIGVRFASGTPTTMETFYAAHVQAASAAYNYVFQPGGFVSSSATASGMSHQAIHETILPAGYTVRVWDTAAIDAAADDMVVTIHYLLFDA